MCLITLTPEIMAWPQLIGAGIQTSIIDSLSMFCCFPPLFPRPPPSIMSMKPRDIPSVYFCHDENYNLGPSFRQLLVPKLTIQC